MHCDVYHIATACLIDYAFWILVWLLGIHVRRWIPASRISVIHTNAFAFGEEMPARPGLYLLIQEVIRKSMLLSFLFWNIGATRLVRGPPTHLWLSPSFRGSIVYSRGWELLSNYADRICCGRCGHQRGGTKKGLMAHKNAVLFDNGQTGIRFLENKPYVWLTTQWWGEGLRKTFSF